MGATNDLYFDFPHRNTYPRIARSLLDIKRDHVILEVGCAQGYFSRVLSREAGWIVSIDIDDALLLEAKSQIGSSVPGISWILASATHLPLKDCIFDRASLLDVMEHLTPQARTRCMRDIHRTLKKGGILVLSTPNKGRFRQYVFLDGGFFLTGHRHFSPSEIRALLTDHRFRTIRLFTSGGIIFAFLFYTFYWRSRLLLRYQVFRRFMRILIHATEAEFYREKVDGCVIFAKCARKRETLLHTRG